MVALQVCRPVLYAVVARAPVFAVRESGPVAPKPGLVDRARQVIRARRHSVLAEKMQGCASTQDQALSALLFLYREGLSVDLPWLDGLGRAKPPQRLPVVLTREEVRAVLGGLDGVPRLMAVLLEGAGLRLLECCRLRVKDVDFGANQITLSVQGTLRDEVAWARG